MVDKLFGLIKLLLAFVMAIFGVVAFIVIIKRDQNIYILLGGVLAFICVLLYILYLFYSGWTEFKALKIKKTFIIWAGIVMSGIIILAVASLFLEDRFTSSYFNRIAMILLAFIFSIRDYKRLKEQKIY
jgi:hypothetical protein